MNPAPNKQPASAVSASAAYAEAFIPESDDARQARAASAELGIQPVSPGTATLLRFLAELIGARAVVEVGTGTGVSGLALLEGMVADGILTSIDIEPQHQAAARTVFAGAGIAPRRARLIAGEALQVLPKLSDGVYDLVLIDGDPLEYVEYVEAALRLLRPGGLLAIHRALADGKVADAANTDDDTVIIREALTAVADSEDLTPVLLPVGQGLLVARRA
ncbi:MAG: class I SAM-dependent methyltransferase [Propioniciclava sp.]|uniref:O-methyltransferase n=1 Tax=Propioniciclava sp. TaxID=2038686 RepID=UPI0039E68DFB